MRVSLFTLLLAGAAAFTGCGPAGKPFDPDNVKLSAADYPTIDHAVREKKGQVVIVDFWATTCPPCLERFPHLVALHTKYSGDGLVCISVCLDKESSRDKVLGYLRRQQADFTHFLWADPTIKDAKDITERYKFAGSIPHMALFGRNGELVWSHTGSDASQAQIDWLIQTELAKTH